MIYWDLDGVLRLLGIGIWQREIGRQPSHWDEPLGGKDFCSYIDENLGELTQAEPSKLLEVAKILQPTYILSCQPESWRPYTDQWIQDYIPFSKVTYVKDPLEKLEYLGEHDFIVEDYPKFPAEAYKKIVLVDWEYNKGIDAFCRVTSPEQMEIIIGGIHAFQNRASVKAALQSIPRQRWH